MNDITSNVGRAAQARRLYHHVLNGGKLRQHDVEYLRKTIQRLYDELAELQGIKKAEIICLGIDQLMTSNQISLQVKKIEILEHQIDLIKGKYYEQA